MYRSTATLQAQTRYHCGMLSPPVDGNQAVFSAGSGVMSKALDLTKGQHTTWFSISAAKQACFENAQVAEFKRIKKKIKTGKRNLNKYLKTK